MSRFATLIDDGQFIASDPGSDFLNIAAAIDEALKAAAAIAAERVCCGVEHQTLTCEVQDCATGEHRRLDVMVAVRR